MKGFFLYSKLWEETVKKEYVVGIWCIVVGAVLFVVFTMYVEKGKVNSPSDVVITNTYQVKDISNSKVIHDEARQRLTATIAKHGFTPRGAINLTKILAYNTFGNHHYIAMEFTMNVVGHPETGYAIAYLNIEENSGQYSVEDDFYYLTSHPEDDDTYKQTYEEALNNVKFCEGMLPNDAKKM